MPPNQQISSLLNAHRAIHYKQVHETFFIYQDAIGFFSVIDKTIIHYKNSRDYSERLSFILLV